MNYIIHTEMPSRRILHVLVALSSLMLSEEKHAGPSCLTTSPADAGRTRVTFLREDAAGVRSLYTSLWSEDTRHPLTCEVNTDPLVTERYRSACGDGGGGGELTGRFDVGALLAPDAPCALVSSGAPKSGEGKVRRRRSWIFPGTLWCGTGSRAGKYEQLGMFKRADRCCREHDHCLQIIQAHTENYGAYNPNFFTVSHCDCDQRFRECLLGVNDTISRMVGYSFFNILRIPCFQLRHQRNCTERNAWGKCKIAKRTALAVFQSPLPYSAVISKHGDNSTDNYTASEGPNATDTTVSPSRKSPKGEHRCSSRYPPTGDTFSHRTTKGRGCKRLRKLHKAAPSRVNATTPSMTTSLVNAFKSGVLMPNTKRAGKEKNARKGVSDYPTQRSHVSPQGIPTQSTTSLTLELHLTSITSDAKTTRSRQNVPDRSYCCGVKTPLRGDTFQPHCKGCTTSHMTTPPPSTTHGLPVRGPTARTLTESPKQDTLKRLWSAAMSAVTTDLKPAASTHEDGNPQQQTDSPLRWNTTRREPVGTVVQSTHAGRGLEQNTTSHNVTDNQLLCGSLKHLDECKYKIRPLQKKYGLQNTESKTSYHCDCTSRLAVQLRSFKQPSVLPELLMDFVSPHCFKLPKEKKCHGRKSCSGGFSKASDLLEALKMIDEKDTVQHSGNGRRRGIPTRLSKRCLRLERKAGVMAHAHTALD